MSEIIQLTEHSRLRIVTDESAENPRNDWDSMLTGFAKIGMRGDSRLSDVPFVHPDLFDLAWAHDRLGSEEMVERWARIFHGAHVEYDSEHGGYWFVDRASLEANFPASPTGNVRQMLLNPLAKASEWRIEPRYYVTWVPSLDVQAQIIKQEREIYRMWAESEVSGVILERSSTWAKLTADGQLDEEAEHETREVWDVVESLFGCYLVEDWDAKKVALDSFELTDAEIDAVR